MENDDVGSTAGRNTGANTGAKAGTKGGAGAPLVRRDPSEWHRRLALGLSAQLPDNAEDARAVLECVGELVETFLYPRPASGAGAGQDRVLVFAGAPAGMSSCRTR